MSRQEETPTIDRQAAADDESKGQSIDVRRREDWETLLSFLPHDYEELAVAHGQLETRFGPAKVRTAEELLRLIFIHVGVGLALRQTVALVAEAGGPNISAMRLHMRMRKASAYLHALVTRLIATSAVAAPELWGDLDPVAVDATTVSGPGATGTDARIHTALRLTNIEIVHVEVTDVSGGESLKRFAWKPGQLAIGDRGYANPPGVAAVVDAGADVLIRLNRGALPVYEGAEPVDVLARLRALHGCRASEWPVDVRVAGKVERRLAGRLVAVRLPEKEAEEARGRVRREYGRDVTDELLEAAGYVALFTTLPRRKFPAGRCLQMYRLRWQIELQFKRWKSICGLDRLPNYRDDTIRSWLYAKVLLALLVDKMGSGVTVVASHGDDGMDSVDTPGAATSDRPLARQAWKVTSILWPVVVDALLPLGLQAMLDGIESIGRRLDAASGARPKAVAEFRSQLQEDDMCCIT